MPAPKRTSVLWKAALPAIFLAVAARILVAEENAGRAGSENEARRIVRVAHSPPAETEKQLRTIPPLSDFADKNVLRLAQAPKSPPPAGKAPAAPPPPGESAPRDPTTVRPDLRPILDPPPTGTGTGSNLALFRLRGRVAQAKGKVAGILDINGQLFMIQEGSQIDTVIGSGTEITVLIRKFSVDGVELEVEQTGKTIRLR